MHLDGSTKCEIASLSSKEPGNKAKYEKKAHAPCRQQQDVPVCQLISVPHLVHVLKVRRVV